MLDERTSVNHIIDKRLCMLGILDLELNSYSNSLKFHYTMGDGSFDYLILWGTLTKIERNINDKILLFQKIST